jgi:hypothetical protein
VEGTKNVGAVIGIGYWVGFIASIITYYQRSGLGEVKSSQGIDWREFLIPNPVFFLLLLVKAVLWPVVLIFWLVTGRPRSPWHAVTDRGGRPARAILRRSEAAQYGIDD